MTHCESSLRAAVCVNVGRDRVLMKMMMKYFRPDFLACQCSISASGNMSSIHELPWSGCWQLDITHTQFHTDGHTAVWHNNKHHWDSPRDRDENRTPSFPAPSLIKAVSSGKENPYWVTVNHFLELTLLEKHTNTNKACSTSINPSLCRHDTHTHTLNRAGVNL